MKNRKWLSGGMGLGLVLLCAICLAAVPGVFLSVTSQLGYQVNGGAGSSGQALCSDGTYFDTPCSFATLFYQTVKSSGTNQTQEPALNFNGSFALTDSSGTATNVGLANTGTSGTYAYPISLTTNVAGQVTAVTAGNFVPRTCNSNGCYEVINGTVHEWGVTPTFDTGPQSIPLPFTMPNALENVIISQCADTSGGCTGTTTGRIWMAGNFATSSFDARNDGSGAAFWNAWGH